MMEKTIKLNKIIYNKLNKLKKNNETYGELIQRLIVNYEKSHKENEKEPENCKKCSWYEFKISNEVNGESIDDNHWVWSSYCKWYSMEIHNVEENCKGCHHYDGYGRVADNIIEEFEKKLNEL